MLYYPCTRVHLAALSTKKSIFVQRYNDVLSNVAISLKIHRRLNDVASFITSKSKRL